MYPRNFKLNHHIKNKIAVLLKYYRKQAKLKQRDFITYNGALICSMDSYSRIENLHPIKSDSIYIYLLHQIDATIEYDPSQWDQLQPDMAMLLESILRFEVTKTSEIINRIQKQLPNVSNDFFVIELKELLQIFHNCYVEQAFMNEKQYNKYLNIITVFSSAIQEMLKNLLFQYTLTYIKQTRKIYDIFQFLQINISEHPLSIWNQNIMYKLQDRSLDRLYVLLKSEQQFYKTKNNNRLVYVYSEISHMYMTIQHNHYNVYHQKLCDLISNNHDQILHKHYQYAITATAITFLHAKEYDKAYTYYHQLALQDDTTYMPAALFAHIFATMNDTSAASDLLRDVVHYENHNQLAFYTYYQMKYNNYSRDQLKQYLSDYLIDHIQQQDILYYLPLLKEIEYSNQ